MSHDPRDPIGPWTRPEPLDAAAIGAAIEAIETLPAELETALAAGWGRRLGRAPRSRTRGALDATRWSRAEVP